MTVVTNYTSYTYRKKKAEVRTTNKFRILISSERNQFELIGLQFMFSLNQPLINSEHANRTLTKQLPQNISDSFAGRASHRLCRSIVEQFPLCTRLSQLNLLPSKLTYTRSTFSLPLEGTPPTKSQWRNKRGTRSNTAASLRRLHVTSVSRH